MNRVILRRTLMAVVVMMLSAACALAQSAVVDNGSDPGSRLNMRSAPGKDAPSVGKFLSGTQVEIIADAGGGWAQVEIGGGRNSIGGYMMKEYLHAQAGVDARQTRRVISPYGTPSVVLRDRASNSYSAVMMLQVGAAVTQIGAAGEFCYVITDDGTVGCLLTSELK